MKNKKDMVEQIRIVADFQMGKGAGKALFSDRVQIALSRRTGRTRHIYLEGKLLATLRPTDGMFSLTVEGARRLHKNSKRHSLWVTVQEDVESFVAQGKSVFAKHVVKTDEEIRPQEEVIVIGKDSRVLAVGKAVLTGREMKAFKHGVAVKVRRGIEEGVKNKAKET